MKFRQLKYQNFRQFGKVGTITFADDGKMTIIYGFNGDGKTTLHQLMQWILYGQAKFNQTTTGTKLYNNKNARIAPKDTYILTWGSIDFEHEGNEYSVRREWYYYKDSEGRIRRKTDRDRFEVSKLVGESWKPVDMPEDVVEGALPKGLSQYFFFDGETMIADLGKKGSDSAKALKTALYSLFDLTVYQKAMIDIGSFTKRSSALGILSAELGEIQKTSNDAEIRKWSREYTIYDQKVKDIDQDLEKNNHDLAELRKRQIELSELIGSSKSKKQLEDRRKRIRSDIARFEGLKSDIYKDFGDEIIRNYPHLLLSQLSGLAGAALNRKAEDTKIEVTPGLRKELLITLIKKAEYDNTAKCICGRCIGQKELDQLKEWKLKFPPTSYEATYSRYTRNAARYSGTYTENFVERFLQKYYDLNRDQKEKESEIEQIDEELKSAGSVDQYINERAENERTIQSLESTISNLTSELGTKKSQRDIRKKRLASANKGMEKVHKYLEASELLDKVLKHISDELSWETKEYSSQLEKEIRSLTSEMLTSERAVTLSTDFQLTVQDSYGDESKSEGQFAVISFAYIGGILKVLSLHEKLKGKEFPLVLDGPFSKLDPTQKKNVIETIPRYAKQIILFSKDPLEEYLDPDTVGAVYTIQSNDERNNAEVKGGNLWK